MPPDLPSDKTTARRLLCLGICLCLAVMTWLVFGQTLRFEFINYDDPYYITQRPEVTAGITRHGIAWAFTHSHAVNWHPLTTISHMLDCQLYGLKAGGHHFTNVLLHTMVVILLFLVLRQMTEGPGSLPDRTGNIWRSAFVAALFAVHPLRVESVAWVSERKDVLSGVFFMLTLAAYTRYARQPSVGRYLLLAFVFLLGLMSKPMLVTLPFVLLLLDYWPLGRLPATAGKLRSDPPMDGFAVAKDRGQRSDVRGQRSEVGGQRTEGGRLETQNVSSLILEKLPLVLLSVASCLVTLAVQRQVVSSMEWVPFPTRLINAVLSLLAYVYEMFWPARLALFYPYPFGSLSFWRLAGTVLILCVITTGVFLLRKRYPYGITGWFWYLGMLVPVIGIVQVGSQARADRYTYLPHIGLYLAVTWAVSDLSASWRHRRVILAIGTVVVLIVLAYYARLQTSYWKNSESLWTRALAVTSNNATAHYNLGGALLERGRVDEAIFHYRKALELRPNYTGAHNGLGRALFEKGYVDEAIEQWQKTLSISPDDPDAQTALGDALLRKQLIGDAIAHYEKSLQIAPESAPTLNALAWVFAVSTDARLRNGARAVELARRADELAQGKDPVFARTLAAAYAESGRFNDATAAAERARALAIRQGNSALADDLRMEIDLYRMNFPLRARPSE